MKNDPSIYFRFSSLVAGFANRRVGCAHRTSLNSSACIEALNSAKINTVRENSIPKGPGKALLCIAVFAFISFTALTSAFPQSKQREYWSTSEWKLSTPEIQGMDSTKLSIAEEFIQNRLPDAYSLLVVKNGYLVYEKYFRNGSPERVDSIASVTKSIMSALIGIALDKGYLSSVDQKIFNFFLNMSTTGKKKSA